MWRQAAGAVMVSAAVDLAHGYSLPTGDRVSEDRTFKERNVVSLCAHGTVRV